MRTTAKIAATSASIALIAAAMTGCGSSNDSSPGASSTACTPKVADSELIKPKTLTVVTNATLPPMQYVDSDNNIVGMRIDLAKRIASDLCLNIDVVNAQFDTQIPGLQGGRWDLINTGMFYTAERAKAIKLVPYEIQGVAISVAKGNPDKITKVEDLSGKSIAAESPGYEYDTLVALNTQLEKEGKEPITIRGFQTVADGYQALNAGQVDGMAIVQSVTSYYAKDGKFDTAISGLNKAPLAMGFKSQKLGDAVAAELTSLRESGYLGDLFKKYGVEGFSGPIKVTTGELSVGS